MFCVPKGFRVSLVPLVSGWLGESTALRELRVGAVLAGCMCRHWGLPGLFLFSRA